MTPTLVGGCLRLEGGSNDSSETATTRPESNATVDDRTTTSTTATGVVASAAMNEEFGTGTPGELAVTVANNTTTGFEGEVLVLFDREVQSARSVEVAADDERTVALSVDALDVGERTVSVEVRGPDVRVVAFERTMGAQASPVALEWGTEYNEPGSTRSRSYICSALSVESPDGTLARYDVGTFPEGLRFLAGTYDGNPENREGVDRWFGGGDSGTVMMFDGVDLRAATTLRLSGRLADTLESLPVTCRMGSVEVAERTWGRDGEHAIPLTLQE